MNQKTVWSNLSGANLSGANLSGANLPGLNFQGTAPQGQPLRANLSGPISQGQPLRTNLSGPPGKLADIGSFLWMKVPYEILLPLQFNFIILIV